MDIGTKLMSLGLVRGAILHSSHFDFVDHGKLFIIVGENQKYVIGFFFINTKPAPFILNNPHFFEMQATIKRCDYPDILDYDSFVDCHDINCISKSELIQQLEQGYAEIRGVLKDDDIELIMDVVRKSNLFTQEQKDTFFR